MVRDGVLVYIYTVGGRTVKWQNQWEGKGCERWVDVQPVVEGGGI
jgi:hypothetical protein